MGRRRTRPARSWRRARSPARPTSPAEGHRRGHRPPSPVGADDGADGCAGVEPGSAGIGDTLSEESGATGEPAGRVGRPPYRPRPLTGDRRPTRAGRCRRRRPGRPARRSGRRSTRAAGRSAPATTPAKASRLDAPETVNTASRARAMAGEGEGDPVVGIVGRGVLVGHHQDGGVGDVEGGGSREQRGGVAVGSQSQVDEVEGRERCDDRLVVGGRRRRGPRRYMGWSEPTGADHGRAGSRRPSGGWSRGGRAARTARHPGRRRRRPGQPGARSAHLGQPPVARLGGGPAREERGRSGPDGVAATVE